MRRTEGGKNGNGINYVQSILVFLRFHICKSTYSLKYIRNPQISTHSTSQPFMDKSTAVKIRVPSLALVLETCPFCDLCSAMIFAFLCILLVISLFPTSECCAKHKKAARCLTEEICVLEKLCAGMRYGAVGCEFSLSESTISVK